MRGSLGRHLLVRRRATMACPRLCLWIRAPRRPQTPWVWSLFSLCRTTRLDSVRPRVPRSRNDCERAPLGAITITITSPFLSVLISFRQPKRRKKGHKRRKTKRQKNMREEGDGCDGEQMRNKMKTDAWSRRAYQSSLVSWYVTRVFVRCAQCVCVHGCVDVTLHLHDAGFAGARRKRKRLPHDRDSKAHASESAHVSLFVITDPAGRRLQLSARHGDRAQHWFMCRQVQRDFQETHADERAPRRTTAEFNEHREQVRTTTGCGGTVVWD